MKLYKYMRYRKGYFEFPTLRITQRNALNDPFEVLPPKNELVSAYQEFLKKTVGESTATALSYEIGLYLNVTNDEGIYAFSDPMNKYGILSFSPVSDSLTMWSHYAENHKGIVVEIDSDELNLKNRVVLSSSADSPESPQQVEYKSVRTTDRKDFLFLESLNGYFLVKSKEWHEEQEIRIVADLADATRILVEKSDWAAFQTLHPNIARNFSTKDMTGRIQIDKASLFTNIFGNFSFPNETENQQREALQYALGELAKFPGTLFLYDLPGGSIKRIFCGCNMSIEDRVEIRQMARGIFSQPEICQMERDKDEFRVSASC